MPIEDRSHGLASSFVRPDTKTLNYAVTEYFTRDIREKRSATMAMILTQLEQDDLFQFTNRLLIEALKYDNVKISELYKKLYVLFYGNNTIPSVNEGPIPLNFLQADAQTNDGGVRIKGV